MTSRPAPPDLQPDAWIDHCIADARAQGRAESAKALAMAEAALIGPCDTHEGCAEALAAVRAALEKIHTGTLY
ncbi:MAG: hypothetical protein AAFY75_04090 [Pseudomonadota bacterium]